MAITRVLALAIGALLVLGGCAPVGDTPDATVEDTSTTPLPVLETYTGISVVEDLAFGSAADDILLDVCLPENTDPVTVSGTASAPVSAPRPVVMSIHGGSWRQGDKAGIYWRSVCEWLASEGFVGVSVNYRLAPENTFPAAIDDVRAAVRWLRDDEQTERFNIDPDRIGAFGGSAGGNLAALLGLEGTGSLTDGSRVAAVVDLSGPADLTTNGFALGGVEPGFRSIQLDYLGCASYADCPQAEAASPLYSVDPSDPPVFVAHSTNEIIPQEQSDALVSALREAEVPTTYITVDGAMHSIAMLDDDLRSRIIAFLHENLVLENP